MIYKAITKLPQESHNKEIEKSIGSKSGLRGGKTKLRKSIGSSSLLIFKQNVGTMILNSSLIGYGNI